MEVRLEKGNYYDSLIIASNGKWIETEQEVANSKTGMFVEMQSPDQFFIEKSKNMPFEVFNEIWNERYKNANSVFSPSIPNFGYILPDGTLCTGRKKTPLCYGGNINCPIKISDFLII